MTPNEIVAANLRRMREKGLKLSREAFAKKVGWSPSRLQDLEHARDRQPGITPDELFALCAHLPITLFDLFLPPPDVENVDMPEAMAPTAAVDIVVPSMGRSHYGQLLFGIPSRYLEPDSRPRFLKSLAAEGVREAILMQHPSVVQVLDPLRQDHREILRELTAALIAEGVVSLQNEDGDAVVVDPALVRMSVAEARELEVKARQLVAKALDLKIQQVERRIVDGELPEPPSPDDAQEPPSPDDAQEVWAAYVRGDEGSQEPPSPSQEVWAAHVRGDEGPLNELAAAWLAQIEQGED